MACEGFERLLKIMEQLRSEDGCPWDRAQTHETLKSYLIEEAYEVLEALDRKDPEKIKEELGDLLFQIVFHAQIAREEGVFSMEDVLEKINQKMVSRHPHVFGQDRVNTKEEVLERWDEHKKREGKLKDSLMEGLPRALPALLKALRAQERAERVGFDWDDTEGIFEKIKEETEELRQAIKANDHEAVFSEIGDLLFSIVNLSRHLKVNPEEALRRATDRFIERFRAMELLARDKGLSLQEMSLQEMDKLWEEVKTAERPPEA
ncbi:MAG: nucleoside triphosphate pyrophosphohydrolase [Nitrospirae bacterium]|nr:MAG: nucleoside triphosphate pyrophosphohydrolase [Nitrospirota bacterium]